MTTIKPEDKIERYQKKGLFQGFREFVSRGNMIDMAVGVVMGTAVTGVVNSIVRYLINPLIAMIFGKPDMGGLLAFTVNGATVSFGAILNQLINFLMVAAAVYFCIIVPLNKFHEFGAKIRVPRAISKVLRLKGKDSDEEDGADDGDDDDDDDENLSSDEVVNAVTEQLAERRKQQEREIELLERISSQLDTLAPESGTTAHPGFRKAGKTRIES